MIVLNKVSDIKYIVHWGENNVLLGDFVMDVDGYFYFWPFNNNGSWSSHSLKLLAEKLEGLNKPWNDYIEEYFKNDKK